jgi:hypothetical protein
MPNLCVLIISNFCAVFKSRAMLASGALIPCLEMDDGASGGAADGLMFLFGWKFRVRWVGHLNICIVRCKSDKNLIDALEFNFSVQTVCVADSPHWCS